MNVVRAALARWACHEAGRMVGRTCTTSLGLFCSAFATSFSIGAAPLGWCKEPVDLLQGSSSGSSVPAIAQRPTLTTSSPRAAPKTSGKTLKAAINFDAFLEHIGESPSASVLARDIGTLKSLPIQEKARLSDDLESLELVPPQAGSGKPSTQQLLAAASVVQQRQWLSTYGKRMDPRVVEAMLGKSPELLTGKELSSKKGEFSNLVAAYLRGENVDIATAKANGVPITSSLDVLLSQLPKNVGTQQVNPGVGTAPGGLGNVPPGMPVVVDWNRQCLRNATPQDWGVDASTNTIHIAFDPAGFPEVGMLLQRMSAQGNVTFRVCTFTMISADYAITAAHCAYQSNSGVPAQIGGLLDSKQTLALLSLPLAGPRNPTACFEDPPLNGACLYSVGSITRAYVPDNFQWAASDSVPDQDIALLKMAFSTTVPVATAGLTFGFPSDRRITLAGYGRTTDKLVAKNGSFLVGWQNVDSVDKHGLKWVPSKDQLQSNACPGDSGGPIMVGDLFGVPNETHQIAAVISHIALKTPNQDPAQACLDQPGFGVPVAGYKKWICETVQATLASCA